MVECQWDSVVLSPQSPVLTGLELTFMGVTQSYSDLFSTPGFVVSPVGKKGMVGEGGKEGTGGKGNRKGKEGRKNGYRIIRGTIRRNFNKN